MLTEDAAASTDAEAWDRLNEFVERDPYTPGAFRFRHALFRDAAYEGLSYRRRGELHAKVGEAYERLEQQHEGEYAELLSLHFFHAGEHEKTYRYSLVAGGRAQAKFANVEAAGFFRRALEVAPKLELDPKELARVWESLGDVSELAGLYTAADEAYSNSHKLHADPRLLLKEGIIRERFGRYSMLCAGTAADCARSSRSRGTNGRGIASSCRSPTQASETARGGSGTASTCARASLTRRSPYPTCRPWRTRTTSCTCLTRRYAVPTELPSAASRSRSTKSSATCSAKRTC